MGYLLILAIILLGGALATLGDRVGSRVGKARLSLFNLRPKKTAILITILTGSLISASTMGILLATSRQFRDAVFRIGEIRRQLRETRGQQQALLQERKQVLKAKEKSEDELAIARAELTESIRRLRTVNRSLRTVLQQQQQSQRQLKQARTQATGLRSEVRQLQSEKKAAQSAVVAARAKLKATETKLKIAEVARSQLKITESQLQVIETQLQASRSQLQVTETQLQAAEAQQQLAEAAVIVARSQAEAQRRQAEQQRQEAEQQRAALLQQRTQLQQDIGSLERERQQLARNLETLLLGLRLGNVAIRSGQVLAFDVFRDHQTRESVWPQLNQLVRQARTSAIVLTNPNDLTADDQVIRFQPNAINRLVNQLSDGRAYFVRFLAAANYLEGEDSVLVIPQVAPYRLVFAPDTAIATLSLTPSDLSDEDILEQLQALFRAVNRQAIQAGMLPDPSTRTVGTFRQIDLFRFVLALKERNDNTPIAIAAVTTDPVFTSGPLPVKLVARKDGSVILQTR